MTKARAVVLGIVVLGGPLLLAGCGGGGARDDPQATRDLQAIGLAYHSYNDASQRGPGKPEDLSPYLEADNKAAYDALKSGRYVFIWNVRLLEAQPTSETVIAYEKDVPTKGGPVLYADTTVKNLTAEEFKSAKLAKPKS
jgi:hypothetical protein